MSLLDPGFAPVDSLSERRADFTLATPAHRTRHQNNLVSLRPARRLLFLINSLEGGGAERVFCTLVNHIRPHLADVGIEVLLLDDKRNRYDIAAPIKVSCLHSDGSLHDSAVRFRRYLDEHRPDLVISFLTRANYLAAAFARVYGYRCVISERSDTRGRLGGGLAGWSKRMLVRALYPRAHGVIAVSEGIRQSLAADYGVADTAIRVIHNPCDLLHLRQLAQQPCPLAQSGLLRNGYILATGRLMPSKRFDLLIQAYAQGNFSLPLVIMREGPRQKELEVLANRLGVAERVLFAGFLKNPYALMARATVFVLCSDLEGFPNSLLEAMGLGLPVIATNCHHGPAEILDETVLPAIAGVHGARHGLVVPTGDANALTQAIRRILDDSLLRTTLAARARRRASQFTVDATIAHYADTLRQQLALQYPETE